MEVESNFDLGDYSLFFTGEEAAAAPNTERLSQSSGKLRCRVLCSFCNRMRSLLFRKCGGKSAPSFDPAPSSSSVPYSKRIQENIDEKKSEIESSKSHWTDVKEELVEEVEEEVVEPGFSREEYEEEFRKLQGLLQGQDAARGFFQKWGGLEMGKKFAEGGQAEIFEASVVASGKKRALKVFKARGQLLALQNLWNLSLFPKLHPEVEAFPGLFSPVLHGRLLEDGRFAFEMLRWWGDLRTLIDERMRANGNQRHPFQMSNGKYLECCMLFMMWQIAMAMEALHEEGILHRDLKASNIFIDRLHSRKKDSNPQRLDDHDFLCRLGDFECSVAARGTGFWRAHEILEIVVNQSKDRGRYDALLPTMFTKKSDVNYGMTCYEILTGYEPFEVEGYEPCNANYEHVLQGKRPELPRNLKPGKFKDLLTSCWHQDPSKRPTFKAVSHLAFQKTECSR